MRRETGSLALELVYRIMYTFACIAQAELHRSFAAKTPLRMTHGIYAANVIDTHQFLLREAVGLGDRTESDRVIDVEAAGVESLAVEVEQGLVLDLGFQHLQRRRRSETFGLFE